VSYIFIIINAILMRFLRVLSLSLTVFAVVNAQVVQAEFFGINFLGDTTDKVTGTAGVAPISAWTNIANATFTSGIIRSSDNSVSASLTLSGAAARTWHTGTLNDGANGSLMDGYMDLGANNNVGSAYTATNVISGLTGSAYDVFLYVQADTARPGGSTDRLPNYTINGTRYFTATVGGGFGGFIQAGTTTANNNTYPSALTYGNYIEIDNVAPVGGAITILGEGDTSSYRSPLNAIEIMASPTVPYIINQPASLRLYTNQTAQFSVAARSMADMAYQWRKNGFNLSDGGNISGTQTNILTVTNLALTDAGDYSVVVTSSFGSITSLVAHLDVVVPTLADLQIDAFNKAYLVQTNGLTYYTQSLTKRGEDGGWTLALDIQGEEDAFERTQSPQQQQLVNALCTTFLHYNPTSGWAGDPWNDDIGWMSLVLARGYQMTGNTNFLVSAEYGFNMAFARGWDTNFLGGGILEIQTDTGKNPLACDSLLQTVCMIYQSTTNPVYLVDAEQIYGWVRTNLFIPSSGLVCGSIDTNGVVNTTPNLYNQGTFLDCANLLHNITGQQVYYNDALINVEFTRSNPNLTVNGIFNVGTGPATWAAEFARGIGHFVKDNNLWSTYYPWMLANANAAWNCRRTDYNVSWSAWTQPTPTTNDIIANWDVNAVAMAQATPASEPGFVNCTNQLHGTVIGTAGSWSNQGNTIAKVFDNNLNTFFDAPDNSGDWVGLDFGTGVSNVIGQINYYPRPGYTSRMLGGVFQGANNALFANPVTLCTVATTPLDNGVYTFQPVTNQTAFRYVRYLGPANGACNVAEIQFFSPNPPPAPVTIANSWNGSQLTLTWPSGGLLLQATNITGPWTTNISASSPFVVAPTQPEFFYRVQLQ
jgi:hypothetical protein